MDNTKDLEKRVIKLWPEICKLRTSAARTEQKADRLQAEHDQLIKQIPVNLSELDPRFDYAYKNHLRVEVTNKPGFEDYTGYGCRTEGKKARFWVGKSTGWKPIYLQILTRTSRGGAAILSSAVESVRVL